MTWEQKPHADEWLLFPDNIGSQLSIDETAFSDGELYTIVTNKAAQCKNGALVAIVQGTESKNVIDVLSKISECQRELVKETTLDMANSMEKIVRKSFKNSDLVIDRLHVQKLINDATQELRISLRWAAMDEENRLRKIAKESNKPFKIKLFDNGDTEKQLLARSRYLLFKSGEKWTKSQKLRAKILFENYPQLQKAYSIAHSLPMILVLRTKYEYTPKTLQNNQVNRQLCVGMKKLKKLIYLHLIQLLRLLKRMKMRF
jgi:transposase